MLALGAWRGVKGFVRYFNKLRIVLGSLLYSIKLCVYYSNFSIGKESGS